MPFKGRPPAGYEDWMLPTAEFMQYEQMNFSLASRAAGQTFKNSEEERQIEHSEAFKTVLRMVGKDRHAALLEELTKPAMEAELWDICKKLRMEGQSDKVYGPASLIMKMRGWAVEDQQERQVLPGITQAKIDELRAQIEAEEHKQKAVEEVVKTVVVDGTPN